MNLYANLGEVKRALRIATATTTHDTYLIELLEGVSRSVDSWCKRRFYSWSGDKYFGVVHPSRVVLEDVLSVSAVGVDSEGDGSFDGESWVEGTDYVLMPRSTWPKWWLSVHKGTSKSLFVDRESLKVTGVWGYGDGESASPWRAAGVTVTLADTTGTSATLGTAGVIEAGETLLVENEQIFVESVSGTTATVRRGVNGTDAAAHTAAAASKAQYPAPVKRFVVSLVSEAYQKRGAQGVRLEMLGTHQIQYEAIDERVYLRALGAYRRPVVG